MCPCYDRQIPIFYLKPQIPWKTTITPPQRIEYVFILYFPTFEFRSLIIFFLNSSSVPMLCISWSSEYSAWSSWQFPKSFENIFCSLARLLLDPNLIHASTLVCLAARLVWRVLERNSVVLGKSVSSWVLVVLYRISLMLSKRASMGDVMVQMLWRRRL